MGRIINVTDQRLTERLVNGFATKEEVKEWLMYNMSMGEVFDAAAQFVIDDYNNVNKPMVISEEQFKRFFRIKGWKEVDGFTGTKESRGQLPGWSKK